MSSVKWQKFIRCVTGKVPSTIGMVGSNFYISLGFQEGIPKFLKWY